MLYLSPKQDHLTQGVNMDNLSLISFSAWSTIMGAIFACFIFMHSQMSRLEEKIERQAERTDKIYEMFVIVQNEIKDLTVRVAIVEEKGKK